MARVCAEALEGMGVDVASFLQGLGVSRASLEDVDGRVPVAVDLALWGEAARLSGDEDFGLHAAEKLRPGAFDVLSYTLRSSDNVGQAFRRLVRYNRLLHDLVELNLRVEREEARLEFRLLPEGTPRQQAEFSLGVFLYFCRNNTDVHVTALRVEFSRVAPRAVAEHRRIFRAPLFFDRPRSGLVLPLRTLELPLHGANPGLCSVLEKQVSELVSSLPATETVIDRVRRLIAGELSGGEPTSEVVARKMRTTPRTLHRWLTAEGTSYREILDVLRRDLALRYLTEERLAIGEAAYLLGFSEASAFHRSFKRWTGKTPAQYRAAS
jgi:AraC-like DNA-binding protein